MEADQLLASPPLTLKQISGLRTVSNLNPANTASRQRNSP